MGKWIVIFIVGFLAFRIADKVDFGPAAGLPGSGKPGIVVTQGGKLLPTSSVAGATGNGGLSRPAALTPAPKTQAEADTAADAAYATAVAATELKLQPTPVVIQPSQEQLDRATAPLVAAATAAVEPPPVAVAQVPNTEGADYQLVEGKMPNGVETKYGVAATRPDGSTGYIWDTKLRPLSGAEANVIAGYIRSGLVRGDDQ